MLSQPFIEKIARELSLEPGQVARTLELFGEGNTLPFIARYRKELTGALDEVQLAAVRDRAQYLEELEARREAVLRSIEEQGKLDDVLRQRILAVDTKQALEDLYLPFRPKRRTRAMVARERGLEPLAELIWGGAGSDQEVASAAVGYIDAEKEVPTAEAALDGARDILAERVAEDADIRGWIRELTRRHGTLRSSVVAGKESEVSKFQDYYDYAEPLRSVPSHRVLAIRRGEAEEYLTWAIEAPVAEIGAGLEQRVVAPRRAQEQLRLVTEDSYKRLLAPSIAVELRTELKTYADEEAIAIFGRNLEQLLLQSPAGEKMVLGLDPGFRTGVKVALVSRTGGVLATDTLYLHQPDRFAAGLRQLIQRHAIELVAIGNGTASRETEQLVRGTLGQLPEPHPQTVVVSEAGASVYSASDVAREELPELDVSLRGAVSIARRLQDPLAELVKIDPKSIGVGQYQHDVNQPRLKRRLDEVVEVCVNRVGVEVNTASPSLLSYVAGIGPSLARGLVKVREERGGFRSRADLHSVPRLGDKAFEQAAGFLRVRGGAHPLDATAVHPERYPLVERMADDLSQPLQGLLANEAVLETIDLGRYVGDQVGLPTLRDIIEELKKPGRDPRDVFEPPAFREDVKELSDLKEGMVLDGIVTNIVAFGAFVDIGVHQDGLVHISQLANRFVRDANEVVAVGQKVKVRVLSVDTARGRVALSMKQSPGAGAQQGAAGDPQRGRSARPEPGRSGGEKKPPPVPRIPRPGEIAPNGIRFR